MTTHAKHQIPWYLWPFAAIWKLLAVIVELTGRLVAMILGIVLMILGILVSLTILGAIVGIPLAMSGFYCSSKGYTRKTNRWSGSYRPAICFYSLKRYGFVIHFGSALIGPSSVFRKAII